MDINSESLDSSLNKDQIDTLFSEEHLSGLDLDEYLKLLKQVPPYFATHVTRQGVRDDFSHHMGGYGEFNDGLQSILREGNIRSTLDQSLSGQLDKESVALTLKREEINDGNGLDEFVNRSVATNLASTEFADKAAVHVAFDKIASGDYGSERGNEAFIIYPMAFCASQYKIAPQFIKFPPRLKLDDVSKSSQFNDFWLLRNKDKRGVLPVSAGILFLPKSTKVDPKTGSKYEIVGGKPVENTEQINAVKKWLLLLKEQFDLDELMQKFVNLQNDIGEMERTQESLKTVNEWDSDDLKAKLSRQESKVGADKTEIQSVLDVAKDAGLVDERFFNIFANSEPSKWNALRTLFYSVKSGNLFKNDQLTEDAFRHIGMQFKLAEGGTTSEEFWKAYFNAAGLNPKVVFYDEKNPEEAFEGFKKRFGLNEDCGAEIDLREMYTENLISNKKMSEDLAPERTEFANRAKEILGL